MRFRSVTINKGETAKEFKTRIADLAEKWLRSAKDRAQVSDVIVKEQLMKHRPREVQIPVADKQPAKAEEAASLGDSFVRARRLAGLLREGLWMPSNKACRNCGKNNHTEKNC